MEEMIKSYKKELKIFKVKLFLADNNPYKPIEEE
jgi:hypothetical protein